MHLYTRLRAPHPQRTALCFLDVFRMISRVYSEQSRMMCTLNDLERAVYLDDLKRAAPGRCVRADVRTVHVCVYLQLCAYIWCMCAYICSVYLQPPRECVHALRPVDHLGSFPLSRALALSLPRFLALPLFFCARVRPKGLCCKCITQLYGQTLLLKPYWILPPRQVGRPCRVADTGVTPNFGYAPPL